MPQLQKPLQGLARFLGLQSQGSLAVNWTPNLVPTYDLSDWIGPPLSDQGRSTTVPQNGTFDAFTVPDGQIWRVDCISVLVISAQYTDSYLRLLRSGASQGLVLAPQTRERINFAVGTWAMHTPTIESGYSFSPSRLFLQSGDTVSVRLRNTAAAGNNEVRVGWFYHNLSL